MLRLLNMVLWNHIEIEGVPPVPMPCRYCQSDNSIPTVRVLYDCLRHTQPTAHTTSRPQHIPSRVASLMQAGELIRPPARFERRPIRLLRADGRLQRYDYLQY